MQLKTQNLPRRGISLLPERCEECPRGLDTPTPNSTLLVTAKHFPNYFSPRLSFGSSAAISNVKKNRSGRQKAQGFINNIKLQKAAGIQTCL